MTHDISRNNKNTLRQDTIVNACAVTVQKGFERMSSEDIRKILINGVWATLIFFLGREFLATRR